MNLSTVKWAQWDKTQSRELCVCSYVCASHCAQLLHTILHRTDLIVFRLTLQTITTTPMMSIWGKGGAGSPSNTKSPGPRPTSVPSGILIHSSIWPQQIWTKNCGAVPLWGRGAGSPCNTMWPGPRPTCMPSFILIHQTPTSQTVRQIGQDSKRQTVAQKSSSGHVYDILVL